MVDNDEKFSRHIPPQRVEYQFTKFGLKFRATLEAIAALELEFDKLG